jgi:hypothetical protein
VLLTSTSVWSGARPRRVAGRTVSVPSVIDGREKLIEGARLERPCASSVEPCWVSISSLITSTGETVSSRERPGVRVPVTTTWSSSSCSCGVAASWARAAWAERSRAAADAALSKA